MSVWAILAGLFVFPQPVHAQNKRIAPSLNHERLKQGFTKTVLPFLQSHCLDCHGAEEPEAELNLSNFASFSDVNNAHPVWATILQRVQAGEMPPADADQPSDSERRHVIAWIKAARRFEAERTAGDPGPVMARRLSNAEYNYTIRDLTGVDIQPTREFPIDPANEVGFDNSAESLSMSPALLQKYLAAARFVAEHMVLLPDGVTFAPHPAATDTDRDKYCVKKIVEFYKRQPTDLSQYFLAAWRVSREAKMSRRSDRIQQIAAEKALSSKYLERVLASLSNAPETPALGPLKQLQLMWRELQEISNARQAQSQAQAMRDFVARERQALTPVYPNLFVDGNHKGSQPFILWKNRQYASNRMRLNMVRLLENSGQGKSKFANSLPQDPRQRRDYIASLQRFCQTYPDAFYVSERGRDHLGKPKAEQEKGRLLSAGFHSMMGYFRDDRPLYDLILNDEQRAEIDRLWRELDFVTAAPLRQYSGFLWFERTDSRYMRDPEFDFARAENRDALNEEMIKRLAVKYIAKAKRSAGGETELAAMDHYFKDMNRQIRWVEKERLNAQSTHVEAVIKLAQRAYRRRLSEHEKAGLRNFYKTLRGEEQLKHEEAVQDLLVSVLMSPLFCYRVDLISETSSPDLRRPLSGDELASRLSYFLWSSMPDEALTKQAAANQLQSSEQVLQASQRMLKDDRVRGLAVEFAGQWLDFRQFQNHNSVDRKRFPQFSDELREAMFEEPVRFFVDVVQNDRSVLDFLYAKHTFVNRDLARHYGVRVPDRLNSWIKVEDASKLGRGGLLPMAVFLTKNSPGLRTSPVKRGYWVARRIFGERIPPPPPNVPDLPEDESQLGKLTLRQALAKHRDNKSCAGCHDRFDALGLVFEGFGPIGEMRQVDLGGRPVEDSAEFPGGKGEGRGLKDLKNYIRQHRENEFVENLCRKLLSYALGRSLILSDDLLVEQMKSDLAANEYRFSSLIESVVTSPQFRNKRGQLASAGD